MAKKKKRIQSGKVVRLGADVLKRLDSVRKKDESWSQLVARLISGDTYWLVPSAKKIFESRKEAMGFSVLAAVQTGKEKPERPVKVREDV